jgi:uncharacterized DUF497 family protein
VNVSRHLHFEWDEAKAMSNGYKHSVRFTLAASVFRDPGIRTMFDEDHSIAEERWIALGMAATGVLLVVVYTWTEVDQENVNVRIISARRATTAEQSAYEDSL